MYTYFEHYCNRHDDGFPGRALWLRVVVRLRDDPLRHDAEKRITGNGVVAPSKMRGASAAADGAPGISRKPGEFRTGRTQGEASRGMAEKRYFENQAMRVAEGMAVRAVSPDGKVLPGDAKAADGADKPACSVSRAGFVKVRYGDIRRGRTRRIVPECKDGKDAHGRPGRRGRTKSLHG